MLKPFDEALKELGVDKELSILSVQSGYPSPKIINLVLRRVGGLTFQFEASASRPEIVEATRALLTERGVKKLDALLVTHCHGDHAGSAGVIAGFGREADDRAPIYLHSAAFRSLTHPTPSFLNETYEIFLSRCHWGLREYNTLSDQEMIENALRKRFRGYFTRTPKRALRFVDHGEVPDGILAVPTPGHSQDCVLYFDSALGVAVPGDTIICTGRPEAPESWDFVIPIFTVGGQSYSMAYERYLRTIRHLRVFFSRHRVRAVLPPHGRFAVTEPLAWVQFAERYFEGIYRAFLDDFLADKSRGSREEPFRACDLNPYIPSAGAHPVSTPSHVFGMLCTLADEGYLELDEDMHTRQIHFRLLEMPPESYVHDLLQTDPGPVPLFHAGMSA
ncbi:MAG: MBL fold metallo-hydrolase [Polyangiaceae bacterium]